MAVVNLTTQQIQSTLQGSQNGQQFLLGASQLNFSIPVVVAVQGSNWPTGYAAGSEPFSANYSVLSTAQGNAFRQAIALWDELISPDFSEITETAQNLNQFGEIRVAFTNTVPVGGPDAAAYAYSGTPVAPGGSVGDIWVNSDDVNSDFSQGTQGFDTFLHEIGHTLGLKHPFEAPVIPAPYDDTRYTVMSYTPAGYYVTFTGGGGSISSAITPVATAAPMVVDIAAVQAIYGAETTTRPGDNTYTFAQSDSAIHSIYDAGGTDTLDLSAFTRTNIVDLRPGGYSSIGFFSEAAQKAFWKTQFAGFDAFIDNTFTNAAKFGDIYEFENNLGIAFTTTIENAYGGAANDEIGGNSAANLLRGNGGNDTIEGREGADTIEGGAATDTAVFSGNRADYLATIEGQGFRIVDQRAGTNDGSDFATGVEQFKFADQTVLAANLPDSNFAAPALGINAFGSDAAAGGWVNNNLYLRLTGDVNGDNRADIVGFGSEVAYVSLGNGNGTFANPIVGINAFGASVASGGWSNNDLYHREVADVNGDGRDDIVGFGSDFTYVSLGQANGTFANLIVGINSFGASVAGGGWVSDNVYPREMGDVNGDGRADIVGFGSDFTFVSLGQANGTFANPFVAISGFGLSPAGGGWVGQELYTRRLGDVNGDGRADIVGFGSDQVYVSLANANGTFANPVAVGSAFSVGAGWAGDTNFHRELADLNADGRADIVGFGATGTFGALAQPGGLSFSTMAQLTSQFASGGTYSNNDAAPRTMGDLNNDGRADLIGFAPAGVFTALNIGNFPF